MYSIWKIMCFFNLKPHNHIALHQVHKIMLFLATSYDPFKLTYNYTVAVANTHSVKFELMFKIKELV